MGRLAGVRVDARRICCRRIMALQGSTEVEHGRLSLRRKEHDPFTRLRFSRCQVFHPSNLIASILSRAQVSLMFAL